MDGTLHGDPRLIVEGRDHVRGPQPLAAMKGTQVYIASGVDPHPTLTMASTSLHGQPHWSNQAPTIWTMTKGMMQMWRILMENQQNHKSKRVSTIQW